MGTLFAQIGPVESVTSKAFTTGIKNGVGISSDIRVFHVVMEKAKAADRAVSWPQHNILTLPTPSPAGLESELCSTRHQRNNNVLIIIINLI